MCSAASRNPAGSRVGFGVGTVAGSEALYRGKVFEILQGLDAPLRTLYVDL